MFELIKALFYQDGKWVDKDQLADHLGLSKKTILNYLDILQPFFKNYAKFEQTSRLVKVNFALNIGIKSIKKIFISNSLISQILTYCFLNEVSNKKELANALATSDSSVFRNIQYLNEAIKDIYGIEFSYSSLDFIGDEYKIQKFYLNLFTNTQIDPSKWPFEKYISNEDALILSEHFVRLAGKKLLFGQYSYMKTALAISVVRLKRGYNTYIQEYDPIILEKIENEFRVNIEVKTIIERIFPNFEGSYPKLLYKILVFFSNNEYVPMFEDLDQVFKKVPSYKDYYEFLYDNVKLLIKKHGLDDSNIDLIYKDIFSFLYVTVYNVEQTDFFVNSSSYFLTYVRYINVDFYRDLYKLMEGFLNHFECLKAKYNVESLLYAIYYTWPNLIGQLLKGISPTKAIIISNYDGNHARMLQGFINTLVPHVLETEIYDKSSLDIDYLKKSAYDVIIVDFILNADLGDKLVLNLENLPMANRAEKILTAIISKRAKTLRDKNPDLFATPKVNKKDI